VKTDGQTGQKDWDELIVLENTFPKGLFLQSWRWGEFQNKIGHKTFRFQIKASKNSKLQALIIQHELPMGKSYLYCPRGPVIASEVNKESIKEYLLDFVEKIHLLSRQTGSVFLKVEPPWISPEQKDLLDLLKESNFHASDKNIQPKTTRVVDITKSDLELEASFKPKTRYNIRLAQKHGLNIKETKDIDSFFGLLQKTASRDGFKTHSKNHYLNLMECFQEDKKEKKQPFTKIFFAEKNKELVGAILIMFHYPNVYYLHGAFSYEHRSLMSPHLLHRHVMEKSRSLGFKNYDLWGIDEKRWPGVTRFKEGFGGTISNLAGSFDLVLDKSWWQAYKTISSLRKLWRR